MLGQSIYNEVRGLVSGLQQVPSLFTCSSSDMQSVIATGLLATAATASLYNESNVNHTCALSKLDVHIVRHSSRTNRSMNSRL